MSCRGNFDLLTVDSRAAKTPHSQRCDPPPVLCAPPTTPHPHQNTNTHTHTRLSIAMCCRRLTPSGAPAQGSEHGHSGMQGAIGV